MNRRSGTPAFDHQLELPAEFRGFTRRELLAGLAAVGVAALPVPGTLHAQTAIAGARRLDFHNHFGSPRWIKRQVELKPAGWERFEHWTPARQIELMDQGGVQTAFISCTEPGVWFGDDFSMDSPARAEAVSLSRDMNEYGARMRADYKGRFGLFAVLPLPDVDASLKEIEYAFDTLHADGVGLLTSYGYTWLGDEKLQPVFDELNRRSAIVYVHPTDSSCCHALAKESPGTVEWLSDTGRSINSLISTAPLYYGGPVFAANPNTPARVSAATRYANVKFIWSHGGGSLIGIAGRLVGNISAETLSKPAAVNSRLYHVRRFYYDTAQSATPILMQGLKMLVGTSQLVFGSDAPYGIPANTAEGLTKVGFTPEEIRGIERENAIRTLLPKGWTA